MSEERWIWMPTAEAEKYRLAAERRITRYQKYNGKRPDRDHGKIPLAEREFIAWDGEGPKDSGYSLLGCSTGEEICYPHLPTRDCLDLFLRVARDHRDSIHVSFGFGYDVSNVLRELSWRHLSALHKFGRTVWDGYQIEHIPRKWLRIAKDGQSVKIYDIFSFFNSSLVEALTSWKIGPFSEEASNLTPAKPLLMLAQPSVPPLSVVTLMGEKQIVRLFKSLRSDFTWADIEAVRLYMRLELKYTRLLMLALRKSFLDAGYSLSSWHGPAALSRVAMRRHGVMQVLAQTPPDVQIAARYAFFGGRFEQFMAGHANQPVYVADINSAYPYYATSLPDLSHGTWRRTNRYETGFGVWHVAYESRPDAFRAFPLPYRDVHHNVFFPHRTEGWYWGPEAALVADDPDATILEGWIFDEDDPDNKPFAWLAEYYRRRRLLKQLGNPAEYTFKLIINSVYGCLAQRSGWDTKKKRAPATHQLEYAGFITSACRAAVFSLARKLGDDLVSIDTDGVTSLVPSGLDTSDELGGWELSDYTDGVFWQSGIYALRNQSGDWRKAKTRGIPRGTYSAGDLIEYTKERRPLKMTKNDFITYGLALTRGRETLNTWREEPREYVFGGTGKRQHITPHGQCTVHCDGGHHKLALPPFTVPAFGPAMSHPHELPWLGSRSDEKRMMDDLTLFEEEGEWHIP